MNTPDRVLIVDDHPRVRMIFRHVAESVGYAVAEAGDFADFATAYEELRPSVIVLDLTMPGADGVDFLRDLADRGCTAPILLVSGQDERVLATVERFGRALGLTMGAALTKPVGVPDLVAALNAVRVDPSTVDNARRSA